MDVKPHKPSNAPAAPRTTAANKRAAPARPQKAGWMKRMLARMPQLLPSSCALCGDAGRDTLCAPCRQRFFTRQHRRCLQCALPMPAAGKELRCGACLKNKPAFDATLVATDYFAPSDQLVLALKFGGDLRLAPLLAELIRNAALRDPLPGGDAQAPLPTMLAAVPLGRVRLQERGFNQALEIAKPLSRLLDIPLHPYLLERVKETQAQSGLPLAARGRNIRKAFVVPYDAMDHVRGRHVGIVDDVMTTGETLNELAATLKRFGARRVTNLVFARTLPG
ncbi:ComF family protein [Herbaspirillum sp. SJZ099]|uniref:ComF family protein n=1 Tax=Herbaspirillum sp. SJZ099 TaxID=2572916 RepID=UPI00119EB6D0|nr:ComF family protein [Herbaspirillum sp. SJZ099]TWC69856.1 ComF family protein [Herbaspirillum sp. SJZ099]